MIRGLPAPLSAPLSLKRPGSSAFDGANERQERDAIERIFRDRRRGSAADAAVIATRLDMVRYSSDDDEESVSSNITGASPFERLPEYRYMNEEYYEALLRLPSVYDPLFSSTSSSTGVRFIDRVLHHHPPSSSSSSSSHLSSCTPPSFSAGGVVLEITGPSNTGKSLCLQTLIAEFALSQYRDYQLRVSSPSLSTSSLRKLDADPFGKVMYLDLDYRFCARRFSSIASRRVELSREALGLPPDPKAVRDLAAWVLSRVQVARFDSLSEVLSYLHVLSSHLSRDVAKNARSRSDKSRHEGRGQGGYSHVTPSADRQPFLLVVDSLLAFYYRDRRFDLLAPPARPHNTPDADGTLQQQQQQQQVPAPPRPQMHVASGSNDVQLLLSRLSKMSGVSVFASVPSLYSSETARYFEGPWEKAVTHKTTLVQALEDSVEERDGFGFVAKFREGNANVQAIAPFRIKDGGVEE